MAAAQRASQTARVSRHVREVAAVLQQIVPLLITLSLGGLVLAVGLHASTDDLLYVLRRPKLLVRAILAVIVIPPIASGLLVSLLPLDPIVKAAIILMAVSPVPPLVPGKELAIGGRKEYAYGVYVAMALLTLVSVPIVFEIASRAFGRTDHVSFAAVAGTVLGGVLAPLAVGVLVRRFAPTLAARFWSIVYKISFGLVLVAFLPVLVVAGPALLEMIGDGTLLAMALATVVALAAGHLLGGPNLCDRATLAVASSVRHPGIAMMIAATALDNPRISAGILLFLLVGLVIGALYQVWIQRTLAAAGGDPLEGESGQPDKVHHA
jgi:BASS family bile acid:Na+ symporter